MLDKAKAIELLNKIMEPELAGGVRPTPSHPGTDLRISR